MTKSPALEGAPHGIRINAVCPGLVDTPMIATLDEEQRKALGAGHPLGRIARAEGDRRRRRLALLRQGPAMSPASRCPSDRLQRALAVEIGIRLPVRGDNLRPHPLDGRNRGRPGKRPAA